LYRAKRQRCEESLDAQKQDQDQSRMPARAINRLQLFYLISRRGGIGRRGRAGLKIQQLPIVSDYLRLKANRDFHRQNELLVRIVAVSRGCHKKAESRTKVEQRGSVPFTRPPYARTRGRVTLCPRLLVVMPVSGRRVSISNHSQGATSAAETQDL
jgi:hypothetical protein